MDRFIRYALEKGKKIRAVYLREGKLLQKTVSVLSCDEEQVTLQVGRSKPITLPLEDVLSCDYARGDSGEDNE